MFLIEKQGSVATRPETSHPFRSHCAIALGSNRTHMSMRDDGILLAFACEEAILKRASTTGWIVPTGGNPGHHFPQKPHSR